MSRTFLLPVTKAGAALPLAILRAATKAHVTRNGAKSLAFRVVLAADALESDRASVRELRNAFPLVLPERSDFVVDLSKPHEIARAMDACDGVVLASRTATVGSSGGDPLLLETELNLLAAAKDARLQHVVKVSCSPGLLGERSTLESGRTHWRIEQEIRDARTAFAGDVAIVRPTTSMDAFLYGRMHAMVCGRTLSVSVKHGSVAFVHPQDVAESVVKLAHGRPVDTNDNSSRSRTDISEFDLTGPEALTFAQVAQKLSMRLDPRVQYSYFPLWAVQPALWIKGVRPDEITSDIALATALEHGAEARVTTALAELLGHVPRTFDEFVVQHAQDWPLQSYK